MKPDMDAYVGQIEELGEEVFNANSTVVHGTHKPSTDAVSRMVVDLDKQIKKRAKFSRRRTHNDDDDIDYINQRNAKFNKKLQRYFIGAMRGVLTSEKLISFAYLQFADRLLIL